MSQNPDRRQSIEPLLPAPATSSSDHDDHELAINPNAPLANMGLSYSTAKYIAPLSFLYVDFSSYLFFGSRLLLSIGGPHLLLLLVVSKLINSVDFAAQNYGMMAKPNMVCQEIPLLDLADNPSERPPRQVPRLVLPTAFRHSRFLRTSANHPTSLASRALEKRESSRKGYFEVCTLVRPRQHLYRRLDVVLGMSPFTG
jgi:hypothetical protein